MVVSKAETYFLKGGGEMGALIRAKDWSTTSLGLPETWPIPLKTSLSLILRSAYPMFIWWGEERVMFHNDAYLPVLGKKHPHALGSKAEDTWSEIWQQIGPMSERVFKGEQIFFQDLLLLLGRKGYSEETYFTFSYSPILNTDGTVGGLFCACNEETGKILGQRRLKALREISKITSEQLNEKDVCSAFMNILSENTADVPFSALYLFDKAGSTAYLTGRTGNKEHFPESFSLPDFNNESWKFKEAIEKGNAITINQDCGNVNSVNGISTSDKNIYALTIPMQTSGTETPMGVLVCGISCHLDYDEEYSNFLALMASQFNAAIISIRALEDERRRAKAMAEVDKAKTAFYHNLFLQAPVAICILRTREFIVELANELMLEFWGKTAEQVLNKPVFQGVPEAKEQGLEPLLEKVFDTGEAFVGTGFPIELQRNGKNELVYVNFVYEALRKADGTIEGLIAVATEVTEHVVARKKVEESESRFKLLADEMPQLIFTADKEGNLNYFNKAVYNYTGLPYDQIGNLGWLESIHPEDRERNKQAWIKSISTGESFIIEHRFQSRTGEYRWFLSRALAQKNAAGEIQIWIGTSTDINDQKMMAEELERRVEERTLELKSANEELLRTNHELEQFAYVSSHDLQEPLRKIQTFSSLLLTNTGSPGFDARKYLEKISGSAVRMSALIKDLLNFSRLSKNDEHYVNTDLNLVLKNVIGDFELLITQKGAIIESSQLPVIKAIPIQINQLFHNLLSNSLKFSEANPVIKISGQILNSPSTKVVPVAQEGISYVKLTFEDNGIGFDEKYSQKIFTIFQRLNNREKYNGTGIGLAICRKIVENHKGYITATGIENKGATFTIYLPVSH